MRVVSIKKEKQNIVEYIIILLGLVICLAFISIPLIKKLKVGVSLNNNIVQIGDMSNLNKLINWLVPCFYNKLKLLIILAFILILTRIGYLIFADKVNIVKDTRTKSYLLNYINKIVVSLYVVITWTLGILYTPIVIIASFSMPVLFIPLFSLMIDYPLLHNIISFMICHGIIWVLIVLFEWIVSSHFKLESDSSGFWELFWFVTTFLVILCVV